MNVTIIHTTPATIASLSALFQREFPEAQVSNILDDSMLRDMNAGGSQDAVRRRWLQYARIAQENGAQAVLSACSTVGAFAEEADRLLDIPVYRIDEAMAREAVCRGGRIAVLATLPSTLEPTEELIRRIARQTGAECSVTAALVRGAYEKLTQGDRAGHDRCIAEQIVRQAEQADVIVLAQASMAGAAAGLAQPIRDKLLTSPLLGVRALRDDLRNGGK